MKVLIAISFLSINTSFPSPIEVRSKPIISKVPESKSAGKVFRKATKRVNFENNHVSQELLEVKKIDENTNNEIKKFLSKNSMAVWDFTKKFDVKTGTALRGVILNSIVSSNLESPILVEASEDFSGIPRGSKFSCAGATKNKRVLGVCNKLITEDEEYEVDIILLNTDGTAGLLGRAYSGKEQYAVGAITAAALKAALDVSLERVNTPLGLESVSTTGKNKIKSGGIGALDEIIQMSTDEYKTQEPKISIDAGKQVLIYFNRRFKI